MIASLRCCQLGDGVKVMRLRSLLCGVVLIGMAGEACAADLSDTFLRGSQTAVSLGPTRWDGIYFGGQVGGAWSGTDFANSTRSLVAFILRNTTIENEQRVSNWNTLGKYDANGSSYGAFIGYQTQWDSAVIGVEANYNRTNLAMSARDSMSRQFTTSDGFNNNVTVTGTGFVRINDYGTIRVKGGYAIDCFMPYGFVGFALGRADVSRTATVTAQGVNATTGATYGPFNQTATEAKTGDFAYGYTMGLGMDYAVFQNFFVRGEYEYVGFGAFNDLKTHIHTARVAAGLKF
jgi:outer membrane immunogenic protein